MHEITLHSVATGEATARSVHAPADAPEPVDLVCALRCEASWAAAVGRFDVRLIIVGESRPVDDLLARDLMWVAMEVLTDLIRRADARSARLGLLYSDDAVSLLVQDDGQGFDPRSWPGRGSALHAAIKRARQLGASVDIDSVPGWGSRVRACFPYQHGQQAQLDRRVRILIAAPQPALRAGLRWLLTQAEPALEIIGEARSGDELLGMCRTVKPDVVLVDLRLTVGAKGAALARMGAASALLAAEPEVAVVGLCESDDDELVADAIRAGARGCVDTGVSGPELSQAVVAAAHGQAILSKVVLGQLRHGLRASQQAPLTDRERQVRALMERGLPDRAIAERLVLSVKTVEKHAGAVLRKTGARNRTELAARSRR
jgi:DNA-binding NarL/FixJ family response regulator